MTVPASLQKLLPFVVVGLALLTAAGLVATRPEPAREAIADDGKAVRTHVVKRTTEQRVIAAKGRVEAAREIVLQPQVNGRVDAVSSSLVPGARVTRDTLLFSIEDADYRLAVDQARTRVAEAEAALALERGRQAVAEREWALFEDELAGEQDGALALRQPQLRSAQAAVNAARSQLDQARLNLSRTQVRAPFNAVVIAENIDVGQIVSAQTQAARLVGTDRFRVRVAVPVADLRFVDVAGEDNPGSAVTVYHDTGNERVARQGRVVQVLADLDPAGQMARLLVEIPDPLDDPKARLLLDSFVDVEIVSGRAVEVARLQPEWLHEGNDVFLYESDALGIRQVTVLWRQPDAVYVGAGLDDGDEIVTTTLATPIAGMKLRRANAPEVAATGETPP